MSNPFSRIATLARTIIEQSGVYDQLSGPLGIGTPPNDGNDLSVGTLWIGTSVSGPGVPSGVTDGDKGDITISGGGTIWTIDPNVVTYAKMQDVSAASRLIGRGSAAGFGDPEEITLGAGLTMTGTVLSSTGGGGVSDGDKGDITVSAAGTIWTIDNDVVTYAKMQNVTTNRLLGRATAGSGDTEEITLGTGLSFTGTTLNSSSSLSDGDKGDITVSGSGTIWTIDPDVVTFAKMQNIATDSLIGRDTAGTGDPENILLNATLEMDGAGNLRRAALTGDVTATTGSNTTTIANAVVTYAKIQNVAGLSFFGRSVNSSGVGADITGTANQVPIVNSGGTALAFTTISGDLTNLTGAFTIANNAVTYAKMQDVTAASRLIGRGSAAGAGDPQEITIGANLLMTGTVLSASSGTATVGDGDYGDIVVTGTGTIWMLDAPLRQEIGAAMHALYGGV